MLRQFLMLQRQDHLEDAGDTGRGFQMADVRLGRADQQRPVPIAALTEDGCRGLDLDGVAQRCPRPVRLEVVHLGGRHPGRRQRLGDDPLLGDAVGHRQTARCAVLVDRATADDGSDPVAVADRVLETLDDDDATTLAADVAVGGRVERLAPAVGRQHPRLREGDHGRRREHGIGAAGQSEVAFPQAQGLACLVNSHQ